MFLQRESPVIAKDQNGKLAAASRMGASGQAVIPVDCVVPDMAASMDDDSGQLHTVGQKYVASGYVRQGDMRKGPGPHGQTHYSPEPVVDLSIPMHTNHEYMGAAYAPRQGQDIFDTWCEPHLLCRVDMLLGMWHPSSVVCVCNPSLHCFEHSVPQLCGRRPCWSVTALCGVVGAHFA